MLQKISGFLRKNQKGQGIVEYALILAFVVGLALVLTNAGGLKDSIEGLFSTTQETIDNAAPTNNNGGGGTT